MQPPGSSNSSNEAKIETVTNLGVRLGFGLFFKRPCQKHATVHHSCKLRSSLSQPNFYLQQKVGGAILRWYKRCVWDQISQELGGRTLHWQSTFLCIAMTATGDRLSHFLSFCNWALYSRCADLINDKYPLWLLNHTLIQLPDCTDKEQQVINGIYMLGISTI